MAKNRNKGFSLIEVIIGVAVLTILLTPVVKQLAQTMQTNRLAKEQQYANEAATDALEYAQKTSFSDLKATKAAPAEATTSASDVYVTDVSATVERTCTIYIYDGTDIKAVSEYSDSKSDGTTVDLKYNVTTYSLNDVTLGSRRTEYTRTLILDDMTNKLSEIEYVSKTLSTDTFGVRIFYDQTKTVTVPSGFEYTSEGSIVQYETDADGTTYISGIVCEKKTSDSIVSDPNQSQLGSMHDLVSTQVALVNGDITNFDTQAESDLYAAAMAYLKQYNPARYDQALNSAAGYNVLDEEGYTSNLKKSITLTIDQNDSGARPYYLVQVDVHYVSIPDANDTSRNVELEYNVFSQKFYYTKSDEEGQTASVPSVYIEYQPFAINGVNYASDEYMYIDNHVDGAKIYLYQPAKDLAYANENAVNNKVDQTLIETPSGSYVRATDGSDVKIHINRVKDSDSDKKRTTIYTNLVKTTTDENGNSSTNVDISGQFDVTLIDAASSTYGVGEYAAFDAVNPETYDNTTATLYLKSVQEDKTTNDRLYTATVIVAPKTASVNTVTLTGAKGGQ